MKHIAFDEVEHVMRAVIDANVPKARRRIGEIVVSNYVSETLTGSVSEYHGWCAALVENVILDQVPA